MTNIGDYLKIIHDDNILVQNFFKVNTTLESTDVPFKIKNMSKVLIKNIKFYFPEGIKVIKPKKLPERMIPEQELSILARIDTTATKSLSMEVEGQFLTVTSL